MILNRYERMIAKRYLLPAKREGFIFIAAGTVELKKRATGEKQELSLESAVARLAGA